METSFLHEAQTLERISSLSLVIALLLALASLAGLLFPGAVYPTDELRRAFLANDLVNLFIGLPVLLGSMWMARRGSLPGLLFWPGGLFYVTYNAIAYAVAMPVTLTGLLNLALIVLSVYAIYALLTGSDGPAVRARLAGKVHERLVGGALVGFGALFFLMAIGKVAGYFSGSAGTPWPEVAVAIADLLVTPTWIAGGVLLWRQRALGYLSGAGLLFQASMLFVGLLVFFVLQPFAAGVPFPVEDFIVIAVMSLAAIIPLGLFLGGMRAGERRG